MEARKVLARLVLQAAILKTITGYDWLSEHYSFAERYNCADFLDVFFDRAVLFKYGELFINSWPGNADFNCTTSIYSRTKGSGIIGVIQKMKFRVNSRCVDYIQTSDSESEKCGEIVFGMRPTYGDTLPPPPFISKHPGPFVVREPYSYEEIHPIKRERLLPVGSAVEPGTLLQMITHVSSNARRHGDLELVIAFTSFFVCDAHNLPEGWFNCGYGTCILSEYVNDGVVNCPFGDCIDEGGCENAMATSPITGGFVNFSKATRRIPNKADPRAPKNFSGDNSHQRDTPDQFARSDRAMENDRIADIIRVLNQHNDIMEGIYRLLEIITGVMINRGYDFVTSNSTMPPA